MSEHFVRRYRIGHWTPWGRARAFDVGFTTREAVARLAVGVTPEEAGGDAEGANGNGSPMRILRVAFYFAAAPLRPCRNDPARVLPGDRGPDLSAIKQPPGSAQAPTQSPTPALARNPDARLGDL